MAVTQYIGSRYAPLFADPAEWSSTKTYEPLTIVLYQGNSYTSKQFVPVGIDITNTDFWAETGNYNAQVEQYRREVLDFADSIIEKAFAFDRVTDMQTSDALYAGAICHTSGFHASGDGGAAYYVVSASATPNNRDVLTLRDGLYATLVITEPYVTPEQFGAHGDGINDDTAAIQAALAKFDRVKGASTYKIAEIDVTGCSLELNAVGTCSIVSDGNPATPCEVIVKYADVLTLGTFKNSTFNLGYIKTLNVSPANSFAYNKLYYGRCDKLNIGVSQQSYWVNENKFYGRIVNGITFRGTYPHNCNKISCSGEGANFVIDSENAVHDNIIELYGENVGPNNINFATGSYNNVIQFEHSSYINSERNTLLNSIGGGFYSKPTSIDLLKPLYLDHLTNVDQSAGITINNYTDYANYLIEVAENETVFIQFNADAKIFRNGAFAYDANMQPVDIRNFFTNPTQDICNQWSVDTSEPSHIRNTTTQQANYVSIPYRDGIKYWRFNVYKYTGADTLRFADVKIYATGFMSRTSKLGTIV